MELHRIQATFRLALVVAAALASCVPRTMPSPSRAQYSIFFTESDHVLGLVHEGRVSEAQDVYLAMPGHLRTREFLAACAEALDPTFERALTQALNALPPEDDAPSAGDWERLKQSLHAAKAVEKEYEAAAFFPSAYHSDRYKALVERSAAFEKTLLIGAPLAWTNFSHETLPCFFSMYPVDVEASSLFAHVDFRARFASSSGDVLAKVQSKCAGKLGSKAGEQAWDSRFGEVAVSTLAKDAFGHEAATLRELLQVTKIARTKRLPLSAAALGVQLTSRVKSLKASDITNDTPAHLQSQPFRGPHAKIEITHGYCNADTVITDRQAVASQRFDGHRTVANPEYSDAEFAYQKALLDYRGAVDMANNTSRSADAITRSIQDAAIIYDISQKKDAAEKRLRRLQNTPQTVKEEIWRPYEFTAERVDATRTCSAIAAFRDVSETVFRVAYLQHKERRQFLIARGVDATDKQGKKAALESTDSPVVLEAWRSAAPKISFSEFSAGLLDSTPTEHGSSDAFANAVDAELREKSTERQPAAGDGPLARILPSVVALETDTGHGSGFFVRPTIILTNAHVVGSSPTITVVLADGRRTLGRVLMKDEGRDLAAVLCDISGTPLGVAASRSSQGTAVFAIGSPRDVAFFNTVTRGVVSGYREREDSIGNRYMDVQHDAAINPGNSGGPLLGVDTGEVIGINTRVLNNSPGIGFAVSAEDIGRFLARVSR